MKSFILALLLMLSFDALALNVNKNLSGSWNNQSQSGHGFSIEVISADLSILYWFVYHPDGTPTFIIAVGKNKGNVITADAYYNTGMKFGEFDPDDVEETPWGKIKITFNSCNSATMEYNSVLSYDGVPYGSGTIPLTRLLSIDQLQCADNPNAGLYQGTFRSDDTDDTFVGFGIIAPNGEFALASFDSFAGLGSLTVSSDNFRGGGIAVSAEDKVFFDEALTISGEINPEYRMVGSYDIDKGDSGSFDLYSIPSVYRRVLTLDEIEGNYDGGNLVTGASGSASISKLGKITGTEGNSCTYAGDLSLPDPQFNVLKVSNLKVTSCGSFNGTYNGYGAQIDYYSLGDGRIIRLVTSDGTNARLMDLYR